MILIKTVLAIISFHVLQQGCITDASCPVEEVPCCEREVIDTIHELGRKLSYAQWVSDPTKNVIMSPLSIATILNLLLLGTDGNTKSEIEMFLNYPDDLVESDLHKIYKNILTCYDLSEDEVDISLFTKIFTQVGFHIYDSFISVSETSYLSDVQNLDFKTDNVVATEEINSWVSESTKGKIEKLFSESLGTDTVTVFVNVIFFNGTWVNQFPSSNTKEGTFYSESGNIAIPMMTSTTMFVPYLIDNSKGIEMISLPYEGNRYSMYILKPIENSGVSLQQIEENLDPNELKTIINQMEYEEFMVTIPRMKIDFELSLIENLKSFGIKEIFKTGANFSRFSDHPNLYVSKIIHKAILEVTEPGTFAAAVTGAVVGSRTPSVRPPKFELNRPSLLFIRDNENNIILFWARVMEPEPLVD